MEELDLSGVDVEELFDLLFSNSAATAGMLTIILIAGIVLAVVGLIMYIFESIGIYMIAKKVGYKRLWMAWIPYARDYVPFSMPSKEFKVLAINKVLPKRMIAYFIWLGIVLFGASVSGVFSAIPYIGALIAGALNIAFMVAKVFLLFPMYKDVFTMFHEESAAQGYAIACTICNFIFPIVIPILYIFTAQKTPREYVVE